MPLSWNEIRNRALAFSQEYKDATRENAESQSFYNDFFNVFGISRRRVASFEEPVKKLGAKRGRIDLFWKGILLAEQKSAGVDLQNAKSQALDYFPNLKEEELPKYILVSDFQRFELYDLETSKEHQFNLADLHRHVELFGFIAGYQKREFKDQDPVNIEASERMGKLHDMLKDAGYTGHELELFLVRMLFCLFADDTAIFEKDSFRYYLEERTREDGSDFGPRLIHLFQILNTPHERRQKNLDETLSAFPYVNGSLFADMIPIPDFNAQMRSALINACYFNWGQISPAIFGSLFQSVMDKDKRRGIGAHYTTEKNIMKILKPLFLDALYAEFERIKHTRSRLLAFYDKLASLTFLDPACGCGNFLILTYRELRLLEIKVLQALYPTGQLALDVSELSRINVDAFYGIEIEEFPARIAEVALWLMDHQMNMRLSETFGLYYARIPLRTSAHITNDNALQLDWQALIPKDRLSCILGNPPFVGKQHRTAEQEDDMDKVFFRAKGAGVLDYVAAWYLKAAQYIQDTSIICAFVSTNSISQGEQAAILWQEMFIRYHIKIHFAHRTFAWSSEARGKAAVHCVIIGFAVFDTKSKPLYDYDDIKADPHEIIVANISPYLVEGNDFVIESRSSSICNVPQMVFGNMPNDGGNLLLTEDERISLLNVEPQAEPYIKPLLSAREYLQGIPRWCLWLKGIDPSRLRTMPYVQARVEAVRLYRRASTRKQTSELAAFPALFGEIRQPDTTFILIPRHSSETRNYVPYGFFGPENIVHDSCACIPLATLYHFGVLSSLIHMTWMRTICGRIKSDFRYSNTLVYNNFPWPQPTPAQEQAIEAAAQSILDARLLFPNSTLADLYDPLAMPEQLTKAHRTLDRAVDAAYRRQPFDNERVRMEYLFSLYQQLTAPLTAAIAKRTRKRKIK
jgi:hypothetical protein